MSVVAETLKETIPFEANKWKEIDLPKGIITEIDLRVRIKVAAGSTVSADADAPYKILQTINVYRGGTFLIQSTGFLLFVKSFYEYLGAIKTDTLPSANATKDVVFELVIHPGYYPNRKDDTSVVIDNRNGDVKLRVLWGDNSSLGTGYTISEGEITVTVWKVAGVPRIREPSWEITTKAIDRAYTDLGFELSLPKGKRIPKAIIVVRSSTGARSDSIVTELGLVDKRVERRIIHRISYDQQQLDDRRRYLVTPITGVVIFDAGEIGYVNIIGVEDIVLAFSTAGAGGLEVLFPSHLG